jgi:hypothetical protein
MIVLVTMIVVDAGSSYSWQEPSDSRLAWMKRRIVVGCMVRVDERT